MVRGRRSRTHRRGFFIVFGWRTICTREFGVEPVRATCPACQEEAELVSLLRRRWFTLFFLPVAPLEPAANARGLCKCTSCKAILDRSIEQFARRSRGRGASAAGYAGDGDWSYSISLYNKLRESPADGAVMLQLLQTYEAMNEPGEAAAAARHFPQALAAEPRCRAVLDRMCSAADEGAQPAAT